MIKEAVILATVVAVRMVTPAYSQYYQDYSGYENNNAENQEYDGAAAAGKAAQEAASEAILQSCVMTAHSSYVVENCYARLR